MTLTIKYKPATKANPPDPIPGTAGIRAAQSEPAHTASDRGRPPRNDLLPELTVERVEIRDLKSARQAVRKTSNRQIAKVKKSVEVFGLWLPVIIHPSGEIIDGHSRVEAARQLGLTEVPCIVAHDLSESELRALRIALNRIQETGEFDESALKLEFSYLLEFGTDLTVTGFEPPEIDRIISLGGDGEAEDPLDRNVRGPSFDDDATTRPGDLWYLGDHRLFCGNAREQDSLRSALGASVVSMVFTDPPFNVSIAGHVRVAVGKFDEFAEASGEMSETEFRAFLDETIGNAARIVRPGGVLDICMDWRHADVLMAVLKALGLELLNMCVWAKSNGGMGSLYRSRHELIFVAKRPGAPHCNNVELGIHGRYRTNIWEYAGATGGRASAEDDFSLHPTVKPVRLVRDAILDVTGIGDVVLDPFIGSGTTILAAELSHRVCAGVEISPAYVDVAIGRWEKMTGREAVHAETGLTFSAMKVERAFAVASGYGETPPANRRPSSPPRPSNDLLEEDF